MPDTAIAAKRRRETLPEGGPAKPVPAAALPPAAGARRRRPIGGIAPEVAP